MKPTDKDILKAAIYILSAFVLSIVPFMAGWVDSVLNLLK